LRCAVPKQNREECLGERNKMSNGFAAISKKTRRQKPAVDGNSPDNAAIPVWLHATESFYKKLNRVASECQLSRYEAISRGLDALRREMEVRNSALNRNIKSPAQSEVFRRTMGQVSRNYWATVNAEEKRERARKTAQARWGRFRTT
jgi:hypothetical protein